MDGNNIISSPSHYTQSGYQPIHFINEIGLRFNLGNVVKYITRFPFKNGIEDIKKARQYLIFEMELGSPPRNRSFDDYFFYLKKATAFSQANMFNTFELNVLLSVVSAVTSSTLEGYNLALHEALSSIDDEITRIEDAVEV